MFNISINKKSIKIIAVIAICIILLIISFLVFFKNNEYKKLNQISKNIVHLNSSLKYKENNDNFDCVHACELLNNSICSLNELSTNLDTLKLNDTNLTLLKNDLLDYTKLNIHLYNSSLSILSNHNSEDFKELYENLIIDEKSILTSTENLSNKGIDITFPKNANIFFSKLNKYVNDVYKSTREDDINNEQKRDFIFNMNNIFNSFSTLKEDYKPAIAKIHEDNRDLSVLLYDINEKRSAFNTIKDNSYSFSIPEGGTKCYDSLEEMLNAYNSYINALEDSIKTDIQKTSDLKNTDKIYDDAFNKYADFLNNLNDFEDTISSYKN